MLAENVSGQVVGFDVFLTRFTQPDILTYSHVLSLCHDLYPFTGYLKNTNENFQKILSRAILLTTLHLREMN
jgi:hypothetical protein